MSRGRTARPTPFICVNPEIVDRAEGACDGRRGLPVDPRRDGEVRAPWIVLRWTPTPEGDVSEQRLDGAAAICAQHEADHLDGIVTFDRISPEARRGAGGRTYAG
jgi:peptide deformylase